MSRTLVLGLLALCGCDPIATGSFKPAFLTVQGQIDGSTATATPPHVRVALLWQNDQTPGMNYADETVDVVSVFPASFAVPLTNRPEEQVVDSLPAGVTIAGVDPAMRWSVATLIVYEDDGNGRFDMVGPNDPPSADRVLAAATDFDVWALSSGKPASADFIGIFPVAPNFSLVAEPRQQDPNPGDCGRFTAQGHFSDLCGPTLQGNPSLLDAPTFTEHLTLVDDPTLAGFTCNSYWGPLEYPDYLLDPTNVCDGGVCRFCRGYQCPPDRPPPGVTPQCAADKLSYVYKTCAPDPSLCGTNICHFGHDELQPGDPIPSDWPCPQS